ncbi:MAG: hypothetical protein KKA54_16180 [Proteobacteria bacterium]|nr:hypothetical protein [Pseudomonadota bacterium]MBU0967910.1 hypothetical protein [Pseudomonadota bacterium]
MNKYLYMLICVTVWKIFEVICACTSLLGIAYLQGNHPEIINSKFVAVLCLFGIPAFFAPTIMLLSRISEDRPIKIGSETATRSDMMIFLSIQLITLGAVAYLMVKILYATILQ